LISKASFWVLMLRTPNPPSLVLQTIDQAAFGFCRWLVLLFFPSN